MRKSELISQIGQLLIIGFDGAEMSAALRSLLTRIQPGGIILFARNIVGPQQTYLLLKACQQLLKTRLFLCVDVEGGLVDRLKNAIAPAPSAASVFVTGDRRLFRKHGLLIGRECQALGFNTDFAPVSDLRLQASRSVMSSRAVSSDPQQTIAYVREFLRGLKDAGVLGCGKHFPGLGASELDSHYHRVVIEKPWRRLWQEDLVPYRTLHRQYPFVMISHAAFPRVTGDKIPASLSEKWITDILRHRIGYRGLVVSDDLEMKAVLKALPIERAAVEHIRAGGNICLICHQEQAITAAHEGLVKEAERDGKFRRRVFESFRRVSRCKGKLPALRRFPPVPTPAKIERLIRQLWEFSEQVRLKSLNRQESL